MLTPAAAAAAISAAITTLESETVALDAATGRILAECLYAERDLPPFDRVAMDGIALLHADWQAGQRSFPVAGIVAAGSAPPPLAGGTTLEVMTGAMLPAGADTVVPVELVALAGGHAQLGDTPVTAGSHVHRQGSDGNAGDIVLSPGAALRGPEIAIAASIGRAAVSVYRSPRIAVISTGDELVGPGVELKPWQIRRSNASGIAASLRSRGYPAVTDLHITDDRAQLLQRIATELSRQDALILSGGVSAGRFDHVPSVLQELGVQQVFHKVAQRPGKPFWFGVSANGQPVFALPGNPVSTLICLVRYVLPALAQMTGATGAPTSTCTLVDGWRGGNTLTAFVPVVRAPGGARLNDTRGSGDFVSLAGTAGFVELAPGPSLPPGVVVPFYTW